MRRWLDPRKHSSERWLAPLFCLLPSLACSCASSVNTGIAGRASRESIRRRSNQTAIRWPHSIRIRHMSICSCTGTKAVCTRNAHRSGLYFGRVLRTCFWDEQQQLLTRVLDIWLRIRLACGQGGGGRRGHMTQYEAHTTPPRVGVSCAHTAGRFTTPPPPSLAQAAFGLPKAVCNSTI